MSGLGQSNHNIAVICLAWSNFKNFIRWFLSWNGQNIHSLYIINWNKRKLFHGASGYNWKKYENVPWNIWLQQGKKFHGASGYNWNKMKMFHGSSGYNWYTMKMFHRVSGYNWKIIKISMEHLVTVRLKWKCSMEHLVTTKKNENISWNIWLHTVWIKWKYFMEHLVTAGIKWKAKILHRQNNYRYTIQ